MIICFFNSNNLNINTICKCEFPFMYRYSYFHKLLPLLMTGLSDELPDIQRLAKELMSKVHMFTSLLLSIGNCKLNLIKKSECECEIETVNFVS